MLSRSRARSKLAALPQIRRTIDTDTTIYGRKLCEQQRRRPSPDVAVALNGAWRYRSAHVCHWRST